MCSIDKINMLMGRDKIRLAAKDLMKMEVTTRETVPFHYTLFRYIKYQHIEINSFTFY